MRRRLWAITGICFALRGVTVMWVTAEAPITDNRGLMRKVGLMANEPKVTTTYVQQLQEPGGWMDFQQSERHARE